MSLNNFKASEDLKTWIKQHEGFSSYAYADDYAGTPDVKEMSIGYGHQIQPGQEYLYTAVITQAEAAALMEADLKVWETFLNNKLTVKVNQKQFDALLNLCYAIGGGNASYIINMINAGNAWPDIKAAWLKIGTYWAGATQPGLVKMREREVKLYEEGNRAGGLLMILIGGGLFITALVYLAKKL